MDSQLVLLEEETAYPKGDRRGVVPTDLCPSHALPPAGGH